MNRSDTAVANDLWTATSATLSDFQAAGGGLWTKIVTKTASATDADMEFVNGEASVVFDNTYTYYMIQFRDAVPVTDGTKLFCQITTDTSSTWKTSGYEASSYESNFNTSLRQSQAGNMFAVQQFSNVATEPACGYVWFNNPAATKMPNCMYQVSTPRSSSSYSTEWSGSGAYVTSGAYDGFKLYFESGNITSLTATLYGHGD